MQIRDAVLAIGPLRRLWTLHRSRQLEQRYQSWAQEYAAIARQSGLGYDRTAVFAQARERISGRGRRGVPRGDCHTVIACLTRNWGAGMIHELRQLGPVSVFDWEHYGFSEASPTAEREAPELNAEFLNFLR